MEEPRVKFEEVSVTLEDGTKALTAGDHHWQPIKVKVSSDSVSEVGMQIQKQFDAEKTSDPYKSYKFSFTHDGWEVNECFITQANYEDNDDGEMEVELTIRYENAVKQVK